MTLEENLRVGELIQGRASAADYAAVYELFPVLRERRGQRAGTLSGGQQQQLAIGRVLVGRPQLILLDEPSEGIQPNVVQEIGRIAVALNRGTGVTIVLVEQNLDLIRATAARCYVMDKGRITAELAPDALADRDTVRRHLAV
jgi:branched-chain amino acid transport system ATP-binding protein